MYLHPFSLSVNFLWTDSTRSILVANVMRVSLSCYEEIGRVGRVTRMLREYEKTVSIEYRLFALCSLLSVLPPSLLLSILVPPQT